MKSLQNLLRKVNNLQPYHIAYLVYVELCCIMSMEQQRQQQQARLYVHWYPID